MQGKIKLKKLLKIPNFRVLLWDGSYLYGSKGYTLYRFNVQEFEEKRKIKLERIASFKPDFLRNIASQNKLLSRLLRAGFHAIRIINSNIIGIVAKNIVFLEKGEREFRSVFKIKRGTRPLGLTVSPDGKIFFGEYFSNPDREEVHIYYSEDGYKWDIAYTFPKKTIRHIHNVLYDPYENCLWILTGDYDKETKIIKSSIDFRNVEIVYEGTQHARAATMIFKEDKIVYATDTESEQNYICVIKRKIGAIEKIFPLPGPSLWSCEVKNYAFFSTHSEPGLNAFTLYVYLFGSGDFKNWTKLIEWKKDNLWGRFFQYPSIILPAGKSEKYLACAGRAVKNYDQCTIIWVVQSEQ